jgi:ABC-type Zn uptake system ZnuABC Zn-binding protein ZnuA
LRRIQHSEKAGKSRAVGRVPSRESDSCLPQAEYLAAEYEFRIIGYVEPKPGIPPSAGHLERLVETIKRTKPDGILTTPSYGRRELDLLSRKTGVKAIVVSPDVGAASGADDWFSFMDQVLSSLR